MATIAVIGLGNMGGPMAANLVKAGHEVSVWNRTPRDVQGARSASSPGDAAQGAEVVWMCLADTAAVEQVLFGANGVEPALNAGVVVVDSGRSRSLDSPLASLAAGSGWHSFGGAAL